MLLRNDETNFGQIKQKEAQTALEQLAEANEIDGDGEQMLTKFSYE